MARFSVALKVLGTKDGAIQFGNAGPVVDVLNSVATTAVAADIAVLVADGASPTQGHVNTLATDWTTLLAGLGAIPAQTDVVLSFDATAVARRPVLAEAIRTLQRLVAGSDDLTS